MSDMTIPVFSRSYQSSEDVNHGNKLWNHNEEVMKDAATGRFREKLHAILLREARKAAWRGWHLT